MSLFIEAFILFIPRFICITHRAIGVHRVFCVRVFIYVYSGRTLIADSPDFIILRHVISPSKKKAYK